MFGGFWQPNKQHNRKNYTMRTNTKRQRMAHLFDTMSRLGFSVAETDQLLKAERTLQRWHEMECGTGDNRVSISVQRDEESGKPFRRVQFMGSGGKWIDRKEPCRDMERAAQKRIDSIMEGKKGLSAFVQGDPRGCALYILRESDKIEGSSPDCYYSRGIAVCFD